MKEKLKEKNKNRNIKDRTEPQTTAAQAPITTELVALDNLTNYCSKEAYHE